MSVFLEESQTADRTDYVLAGATNRADVFPPSGCPVFMCGETNRGRVAPFPSCVASLDYLEPKRLVIWPPVPRLAAKTSYAPVPGSPHNE